MEGDIYIATPCCNTTMWYKICCHILQTMSIIITTLWQTNSWHAKFSSYYVTKIIKKMALQPYKGVSLHGDEPIMLQHMLQ